MLIASEFWGRVNKGEGCWIWTGPRLTGGYGSLWVNGKKCLAHRVAWELANGKIPHGMCVLHSCDNPPCVRHLFIGTRKDNMQDCAIKGRTRGTFKSGELSKKAKLKDDEVAAIRALRGKLFQKELAERFGVTKKTIGRIQRGESRI